VPFSRLTWALATAAEARMVRRAEFFMLAWMNKPVVLFSYPSERVF
jgi:hypothetical protein